MNDTSAKGQTPQLSIRIDCISEKEKKELCLINDVEKLVLAMAVIFLKNKKFALAYIPEGSVLGGKCDVMVFDDLPTLMAYLDEFVTAWIASFVKFGEVGEHDFHPEVHTFKVGGLVRNPNFLGISMLTGEPVSEPYHSAFVEDLVMLGGMCNWYDMSDIIKMSA